MTFTGTVSQHQHRLERPVVRAHGQLQRRGQPADRRRTTRATRGSGGALSDTDTVAITVNAVNDAPVNTVPAPQTTNEDTGLVFSSGNGNAIID